MRLELDFDAAEILDEDAWVVELAEDDFWEGGRGRRETDGSSSLSDERSLKRSATREVLDEVVFAVLLAPRVFVGFLAAKKSSILGRPSRLSTSGLLTVLLWLFFVSGSALAPVFTFEAVTF